MSDTYSSRGFALSLTLFVLLLAVYAILQSPLFTLRSIEVHGGDHITSDDILQATGLAPGTNLFSIDLGDAAQVIQQNPVVADAAVRRKIPGALVITIREREPVAYLAHRSSFWLIDEQGIPLFTSESPTEALPLITIDPPVSPNAGQKVDRPDFILALEFSAALSTRLLADISELHVDQEGGITAYTRGGITVSLGQNGDMPQKARVFAELMEQIDLRGLAVSHIDLRHPTSPVFREKR